MPIFVARITQLSAFIYVCCFSFLQSPEETLFSHNPTFIIMHFAAQQHWSFPTLFTSANEDIFYTACVYLLIYLSVRLSVSNFTSKLPIGSSWKFYQRCNLRQVRHRWIVESSGCRSRCGKLLTKFLALTLRHTPDGRMFPSVFVQKWQFCVLSSAALAEVCDLWMFLLLTFTCVINFGYPKVASSICETSEKEVWMCA